MDLAAKLNRLPREQLSPAEKLRQALELHEEGVALQRLKLRRNNPGASEERIEELLWCWLAREAPFESA